MTLGPTDKLSITLNALSKTIDERASSGDASSSYTAKLLAKGPARCAKKLGEEAVELAIALSAQDDNEVIGEASDLLYHLLVALRSRDISLDDVAKTLSERQGISGLDEKASRTDDGV